MELTPGAAACASCAARFLCLDEPTRLFAVVVRWASEDSIPRFL